MVYFQYWFIGVAVLPFFTEAHVITIYLLANTALFKNKFLVVISHIRPLEILPSNFNNYRVLLPRIWLSYDFFHYLCIYFRYTPH